MIAIDKNIDGTNLAKVLHYYGLLTESGYKFKTVCPFHHDKLPSMLVDLTDGSWYCFGCCEGGDAFAFVQHMNNKLDTLHAYMKYENILHMKSTKAINVKKINAKRNVKATAEAYNIAYDYYFGLKTIDWSKNHSKEKHYMLERGFNSKTLNLCKAKLTYTSDSYPLIFPMFDNGIFKGWVCRAIDKKIADKRKYLYNEGFSRATTLVGTYNKDYVFLVEGYMDQLKFRQFGIENVVAILGWKLSPQQISKLKEAGVKYVISALDNDDAGKKGSRYVKQFFKTYRFQYPSNVKDAGEMDSKTFHVSLHKTMQGFLKFRRKNHGTSRRHQK